MEKSLGKKSCVSLANFAFLKQAFHVFFMGYNAVSCRRFAILVAELKRESKPMRERRKIDKRVGEFEEREVDFEMEALEWIWQREMFDGEEADLAWCRRLKEACPCMGL